MPLVTAASWVTLLILARSPLKRTRELEKESLPTVLPPDGAVA